VESQPDRPDDGDPAPVGWQGPDVGLPERLVPSAGSVSGLGDGQDLPTGYQAQPPPRRARGWTAMVLLLAVALCGLAAGAAGVVRQLLPRQFSVTQRQQIMAWEISRRWRAMPVGQIFPAAAPYQVSGSALYSVQPLSLTAVRLGIASQGGCSAAVSEAAATILAHDHCTAMLRATYIDASGSMLVTLGIAVLPASGAAHQAYQQLSAPGNHLVLRPLSVAGTPAASFRDNQRQYSFAVSRGPYVILATAGFTDGRPHLELATDSYYKQEMKGLANGLADAAASRLAAEPPVPRCPGAPGC
jgi:hypothetical protein